MHPMIFNMIEVWCSVRFKNRFRPLIFDLRICIFKFLKLVSTNVCMFVCMNIRSSNLFLSIQLQTFGKFKIYLSTQICTFALLIGFEVLVLLQRLFPRSNDRGTPCSRLLDNRVPATMVLPLSSRLVLETRVLVGLLSSVHRTKDPLSRESPFEKGRTVPVCKGLCILPIHLLST